MHAIKITDFMAGVARRLRQPRTWIYVLISIAAGSAITSYWEPQQKGWFIGLRPLYKELTGHPIIAELARGDAITVFHPVRLIQSVRSDAQSVLRDDVQGAEVRDRVLAAADILIAHAKPRQHEGQPFVVWEYEFDWPTYGLAAPWRSGMAQGLALETLLAAWRLTANDTYVRTARLAANALAVPIDAGGTAIYLDDGIWFEEYAGNIEPPRVLNGHMFALEGLMTFAKFDASYQWLVDAGLAALRAELPKYDLGVWAMYDQSGIPAQRGYQGIHIRQLRTLYKATGIEEFRDYADRFQFQMALPFNAAIRMILYPQEFVIGLSFMNGVAVFMLLLAWERFVGGLKRHEV